MENIKGYRNLTQSEIDCINMIKYHGESLRKLIMDVGAYNPDMRWVNIGQTYLQQGIMALVRSIAKPEGF